MKQARSRIPVLTAAVLAASVGFGVQSLAAQSAPGSGPTGPVNPGPTEPSSPRELQPTIPAQPAPRAPSPGQPGAIPEIMEGPERGGPEMIVSPGDIKKAQQALRAKGLNPGMDGVLDAKTQQALQDFQKSNNLPATGVLDEKTLAKLGVNQSGEKKPLPEREKNSQAPR